MDFYGILEDLGIHPLGSNGVEIRALCPQHEERTGRPDSHPSWYFNTEKFVFICFSCGATGTLADLYEWRGLEAPEDLATVVAVAAIERTLARQESTPVEPEIKVSEWQLRNFADVPDRMLQRRHLTRAAVDHYGVRWDKARRTWVLPIRDIDGVLMGFQFRAKGVEINAPTNMKKSQTLFGVSLWLDVPRIAVVESPLDAVRLYSVGIPAVASMGAYVSDEQISILTREYREVVLALDSDKAGISAMNRLEPVLWAHGAVVYRFDYSGLGEKDPGDIVEDSSLLAAWKSTLSFKIGALL